MSEFIACSECFKDFGLKCDAIDFGEYLSAPCPSCKATNSAKLSRESLSKLAYSFFVMGTTIRYDYGAAPQIQFNTHRKSESIFSGNLADDIEVFERQLGIGFFYYSPRTWMCGEIEPLISLQNDNERESIIERIILSYPSLTLNSSNTFFRIRKNPTDPTSPSEFDAPPPEISGRGRLDSIGLPVLYASPDMQTCLHECRVAVTDNIFAAKLTPKVDIKLLDLTKIIDENVTEFESLDEAIRFLFLAGEYSYPISRDIAKRAMLAGYDGIAFPSYFGFVRTGTNPIETTYGLSMRRIPELRKAEQSKIIPNIAIFGRPITDGKLNLECIHRLQLRRTEYVFRFGPNEVPI